MAEKKLSPDELRAQQTERETREAEAKKKAHEEAEEQRKRQAEARLREQTDDVKATWYPKVQEASAKDGVRFVMIATVVSDAARHPCIKEVIDAIKTDGGYTCEVASIQPYPDPQHRGIAHRFAMPNAGGPYDQTEGFVVWTPTVPGRRGVTGTPVMGWRPANLPRFGLGGTTQAMIVRW